VLCLHNYCLQMKDRIILLIKAKNLTAAQFADEIGVQKSSISHIISGRNNASLDFIQKVLLRYPEVNMEWLMFGKGPLFKGPESSSNVSNDEPLNMFSTQSSASVDLFSDVMPGIGKEFRKEIDLSLQAKPAENTENDKSESQSSSPQINGNVEQTSVYPNRRPEHATEITGHEKNSTKIILKIVEFYSDNSYREYFPE